MSSNILNRSILITLDLHIILEEYGLLVANNVGHNADVRERISPVGTLRDLDDGKAFNPCAYKMNSATC